jgi:hypothetical protein
MRSPFPGFDPFLEDQGYWKQFHTTLLSEAFYALTERLPDAYEVRIEERLSLVYENDDGPYRHVQPDALILRSSHPSEWRSTTSATATLEPVVLTLPNHQVVEVIEKRLVIREFPGHELVTAIELLSPSNKRAPGDSLYDQKRQELINQKIHLAELDLLIGGERLPMVEELPAGHYYAFVSRAERRPHSETYAWTIHDPLPRIPIPLRAPDPDTIVDLASLFTTVYERSRLERRLDYAAPLTLPLSGEDRAWAESLARATLPPEERR